MVQPVGFNFIHGSEILAKLALRKSLPAEPLEIVYRQLCNVASFVLAKRHPGLHKFDEKI